jgi:DNA-directed RNA polymerase specialized sigma24 family protein
MLLALAYRMLGQVTEAEDVVQDAWLRWSAADRDGIANPAAFLTTVTTRLASAAQPRPSPRRRRPSHPAGRRTRRGPAARGGVPVRGPGR